MKKKLNKIFYTSCIVLGLSYFIYHLVNIDNGISSYFTKRSVLETTKIEVEDLKNKISNIKFKINSLTREPFDRDIIDETARRLLGYKQADEIVFDLKK